MNTVSEYNRNCYFIVNLNNGSNSACNRTNAQLEGESGEYNELLFHSESTVAFYTRCTGSVSVRVCACTVTVTPAYTCCVNTCDDAM